MSTFRFDWLHSYKMWFRTICMKLKSVVLIISHSKTFYKILLLFSKFLIIFFFTWLILLFFTYEHASKKEIHYLHVYVFQSRKNTNITQYQTCKEIYIMSLVSLKFQQFPLFTLLWALDQITVSDPWKQVQYSVYGIFLQCTLYILQCTWYILYFTVYMVYFTV